MIAFGSKCSILEWLNSLGDISEKCLGVLISDTCVHAGKLNMKYLSSVHTRLFFSALANSVGNVTTS